MPSQKTVALSSNRDQLKEGSIAHSQLNLDLVPGQVMILLREMSQFVADVNLAAQIMKVPVVDDITRANKENSLPRANYFAPYIPTFLHSVVIHKNPSSKLINRALLKGSYINGRKRDFTDLSYDNSRMFFDYKLYENRSNADEIKKFASAVSYKVIKAERDIVVEYRFKNFLQHILSFEKKAIGSTTAGGLGSQTYIDFKLTECLDRYIDNAEQCATKIKCGAFEVDFSLNQQAQVRFFLEVMTKLIPSVCQFITDRISKDDVLTHSRAMGNSLTKREYELAIDNLDSSSPYFSAIINDLNLITNIDPRTGCNVRIKDVNYNDMKTYLKNYLPGLYSVLYTSRNAIASL